MWKQREYSQKITMALRRIMKKSLPWYELRRSVFASTVLHGIGPSTWANSYSWCQIPLGIGDVLIPADTKLTMENLPMFIIYRQYTAMELWKQTHVNNPDPGWNMPVVEKCIKWADQEAGQAHGHKLAVVLGSGEDGATHQE